ncbi:hypothetical protein QBC38DRAFT_503977 [Podospora fimiseda]|uniref:Uncharacterized protein n=1 Tax=Podospora fimiseda TaxID=252190 RepID=A0AAN7BE69_9PEZI|nr:hypothetical protein QBC38DRAFT_503977 [Podospora fimiseda]
MAPTTFLRFPDLPQELQDLVWEHALRPMDARGIHRFSILQNRRQYPRGVAIGLSGSSIYKKAQDSFVLGAPRTTNKGGHYSWTSRNNTSAYLYDAGLWEACDDSLAIIQKNLVEVRLQSSKPLIDLHCTKAGPPFPLIWRPDNNIVLLSTSDMERLIKFSKTFEVDTQAITPSGSWYPAYGNFSRIAIAFNGRRWCRGLHSHTGEPFQVLSDCWDSDGGPCNLQALCDEPTVRGYIARRLKRKLLHQGYAAPQDFVDTKIWLFDDQNIWEQNGGDVDFYDSSGHYKLLSTKDDLLSLTGSIAMFLDFLWVLLDRWEQGINFNADGDAVYDLICVIVPLQSTTPGRDDKKKVPKKEESQALQTAEATIEAAKGVIRGAKQNLRKIRTGRGELPAVVEKKKKAIQKEKIEPARQEIQKAREVIRGIKQRNKK